MRLIGQVRDAGVEVENVCSGHEQQECDDAGQVPSAQEAEEGADGRLEFPELVVK